MAEIEDTETFPAGLRVLVVDADPTTLLPLERLLLACHYQVTIRHRATDALSLLREKQDSFDLVLSEIHLPGGMHGLQLLEIIGLEMDLPVVVMSHDGRKDMVMKIIVKGACDYLLKPVRIEEIRVIWQHVVRKRRNNLTSYMLSKFLHCENPEEHPKNYENDHKGKEIAMQGTKGSNQSSNHEKDIENQGHQNLILASPSLKKPRMVWTPELHDQFVAVVNHVGLKNAVPKKILELMNVPGLTRENIASHLQKYRLHLRGKSVNTQNKSKGTTSIYLKNFGSDCSTDNTNSQASALSKQLESQCSVFSEVDSQKMSILAVGTQVDQQVNCYNNQGLSLESIHRRGRKSWCYDTATIINPMPHHDHEILEPEKDNVAVMQRLHQSPLRIEMRNELGRDEAPLNMDHVDVAGAAYVSLSVPSTMSTVEDETEVEDTHNASSFILNIGGFWI